MNRFLRALRDFLWLDEAQAFPVPGLPIDADGAPLKLPDPAGIADAGTVAGSSQPGQTVKDTSRKARYADFDAMDEGDIAAVLDATVEMALVFDHQDRGDDLLGLSPFSFKVDGTKLNAVRVIEELCSFTGLREKLPLIARDVLKYGDAYLEHVMDQDTIVRLQTYYPTQIFVTTDDKGNLDPSAAYTQIDVQNRAVATWAPDEMVHFKFVPSDREPYSKKGLLDDLRTDWSRLSDLENGLVLARTSRAYPRNLHYIDMTNKTSVDAQRALVGYIRAITKQTPTRDFLGLGLGSVTRTDLAPNEDIFIPTGYVPTVDGGLEPKLNKVEILDPSLAGLSAIPDVEYIRRKMFARVPADIVGIPTDNADLTAQYSAYARLVRQLQRALEVGLRTLFMRALILNGIAPTRIAITWPEVQTGQTWKYVDGQYKASQQEQLQVETGTFSRRQILIERYGKTETEADAILAEVEQEKARFGAIQAPQSRAGQQNTGNTSGGDASKPAPTDTPATPQKSADQGGTS
jgi:hypothetical protein